ncbi:MAG: hypothetical protein ACYDHU_12570, partial [Acidimicrobiales bacterium]
MTRRTGALVGTGAAALVVLAVSVSLLVAGNPRSTATGSKIVRSANGSAPRCPGTAPCEVTGATGSPVQLVPWSSSAELSFYRPPAPLAHAPPGTLNRIEHQAPGV